MAEIQEGTPVKHAGLLSCIGFKAVDRQRKIDLIGSLPVDFDALYAAHVRSQHDYSDASLFLLGYGYLFEELVRRDPSIFPQPESNRAVNLREILAHPKKIKITGYFTVPDFITEENGEITGCAEIKAGCPNDKDADQILSHYSSIEKLIGLAKTIVALPDFSFYPAQTCSNWQALAGLTLADRQNFPITLVLPTGIIHPKAKLSPPKAQALQGVKIVKSVFNTEELKTMNSYLTNRVKKGYV